MFHFLELFCFDVTENNHLEKRGLFLTSGFDGNGKMHIGIKCFMPNGMWKSFGLTHETYMINFGITDGVKHVK